jgi:transposase, IS30 family
LLIRSTSLKLQIERLSDIEVAVSTGRCESWSEGIRMPRHAPNKMPTAVKRRYFELIRTGLSGSAAAQEVGVSLSCGSLWFIDAGRVSFVETSISRYLFPR